MRRGSRAVRPGAPPPGRRRGRAAVILLLALAPGTLRAQAGPDEAVCAAAIALAEARHGIPSGLLLAMGMVESGLSGRDGGARQPWPWTTNVEGRGGFHRSRAEAILHVQQARQAGADSIDVGCLQVNLRHHPGAFASLDEAFDPVRNADYAARFLIALRARVGGDWLVAAGHYHSGTPEFAARYRQLVTAAYGRAPATTSVAPLPVAARTVPALPSPRARAAAWASRTAESVLRAAGFSNAPAGQREELRRLLLARVGLPVPRQRILR